MSSKPQPDSRPRVEIDLESQQVSIDGVPVPLTKTEFRIFQFLFDQKGIVCTRRQIIDAVQGANYPVTDRSVDVQTVSIRKKLGAAGKLVKTVRGKGFRFQQSEMH